jgi:hypothetical protein
MKKSVLNLGKTLNRAEQKLINGGYGSGYNCGSGYSQSNCNEYCHSVMVIYSNNTSNCYVENILTNSCGVTITGSSC